jgi:uncharacterized LabA/DUF88 family protein
VGKNVAVFVDVANIFYAAKAAGVDIDYVTLLKSCTAGRDLVRAYAYTGLDPENENQRNFHDFLRRHGYKVVSKDIRKYGDGKVKANLDIELVVDMMKTARNLDIAIVISGDGDFAPAIRAVQEQGVRVEVISFRGNTSSDLIEVADLFTDIAQIAKVEKGSSRSGRRVADDDEDLSMTEVPEKQSEGTGERRRRGGRGRSRSEEAAEPATTSRGRGRSRTAAAASAAAEVAAGGDAGLVALPGEKLSGRAAAAAAAAAPEAEPEDELDVAEGEGEGEAGARRRRRRRGGRGRGRGRGEGSTATEPADASGSHAEDDVEDEDRQPADLPAPKRSGHAFGSVWDSQLGVRPAASSGPTAADLDDADLDEPPIPEYLISERRQQSRGAGARGGRAGRGGAYAAAIERERFGGRGSTPSRFSDPAPRRDGGFRERDRDRGPVRSTGRPAGAPRPVDPDEPWTEVPADLEAMLRAELAKKEASRGGRPAPKPQPKVAAEAAPAEKPARGRGRARAAAPDAAPAAEASAPAAEAEAPKKRTTRSTAKKADAAPAAEASAPAAEAEAPKKRTTRRKAEPEA